MAAVVLVITVVDRGANMSDNETASDPPCECTKPNWEHHLHWRNTAEYNMEYCPRCEDIKTFHWKSFWRRLRGLFSNETL